MIIKKNGKPFALPPFNLESAKLKVKSAEDAWNSKDPIRVANSYTEDSVWRNRTEFFSGRAAIIEFLTRKWKKEVEYKLQKELWCYTENRISVRFEYEWFDNENLSWMRTHGNEHWEFNSDGLMQKRDMSANDYQINELDRKL
ncbi:nuclear transport factor 2 family protein [Pigmentibacter sp. JX0631]|uniref:nuclear transport factor 2 family protein n=1 Tax=Pigmentibacter sp. JX0631 TaxID=2976982 RepID=UPI00246967A7|nr:nuclear transport factor 2 family protein [Pigmentibacter sp. JX0631]WGL59791.1 nuclear transport factor 2 family protein [Pigmentibacter sp. JX0631]